MNCPSKSLLRGLQQEKNKDRQGPTEDHQEVINPLSNLVILSL